MLLRQRTDKGRGEDWTKVVLDRSIRAIAWLEDKFGKYPYPQITTTDRVKNGGMEYPMLTLDSGKDPYYKGLLAHEIAHNWFYGMVGSNETYRAFLDEGFIFTGFANGKIAMIYPDSGAVRLELPVTLNEGKSELERIVDVDGRPIIVNGILVSASYQGNILALNLRDGKGIWQQELSTYKDLTANGNRIVAVDSEDIVRAFGTATGALIWAVSYTHLTLPTKA